MQGVHFMVKGDRKLHENEKRNLRKEIIFLFVLINIASFPCIYFLQLSNGLDQSWIFALNYINNTEAKFGEDHFFTYGPLGFLGRCQDIGNNLFIGVLFWMLITLMQIYLYKRLFDQVEHLLFAGIASALIILALPVSEADLYLCFLNLIALLLVYRYEDYYSKWIAVFLSGVIFLFKFSGTVLLMATLTVFVLCVLAEKKPVKTIIVFLCCFMVGPIGYFIYHPSLQSLFRYIRAAAEISLGYNTSMSLDTYGIYYFWVVCVVICYVYLLFYGICMHRKHWNCFLMLAPACFFWYKEGFVRNDGHYTLALVGLLLICSLLLFFVDFRQWLVVGAGHKILTQVCVCCLCVIVLVPVMGNGKTLEGSLQTSASNIFQFPKLLDDCRKQDRSLLQEHNQQFMEIIGDHTYTTFPWEITENISYENRNFKIAPLLQNYTIYTPYLDCLNARFYIGEDAPEYIIMYLSTIDGRLPLVETPATWENIYKNYGIDAVDGEKLLLKKREKPLRKESAVCDTKMYRMNEWIDIPKGSAFAEIDTRLSVKGRLENLIYKILPVNLEVVYTDGTVRTGRVILDNFTEGIDIGSLVWDQDDFQKYMKLEERDRQAIGIRITGPGAGQYDDHVEVTFYSGGWRKE